MRFRPKASADNRLCHNKILHTSDRAEPVEKCKGRTASAVPLPNPIGRCLRTSRAPPDETWTAGPRRVLQARQQQLESRNRREATCPALANRHGPCNHSSGEFGRPAAAVRILDERCGLARESFRPSRAGVKAGCDCVAVAKSTRTRRPLRENSQPTDYAGAARQIEIDGAFSGAAVMPDGGATGAGCEIRLPPKERW